MKAVSSGLEQYSSVLVKSQNNKRKTMKFFIVDKLRVKEQYKKNGKTALTDLARLNSQIFNFCAKNT